MKKAITFCTRRLGALVTASAASMLLTACGLGGMGGPYPGVPEMQKQGTPRSSYDARDRPEWVPPARDWSNPEPPVAPPQVGYRIDQNRYFEIVPYGPGACSRASIDYVDTARNIRARVLQWNSLGSIDITIDAANDEYLIGPVSRGNTDCSSGGGRCSGGSLPYSTDGGRTWHRTSGDPSDAYSVSGSTAYQVGVHDRTRSLDLASANAAQSAWRDEPRDKLTYRKDPIDAKFHCQVNGKE